MKKFFSVLLTVLTAAVLAFSLTACEKPSEGLDYELNENQNAYYVTGLGTCADTNIVIPSEYQGLPVIGIGNRAFYGCTSLTSITIPDSVTSIGDSAFSNCPALTNVTIGNSVTSIGICAFIGCSALTNITIPDSVTSIGEGAFSHCSSLTSINIPYGVTNIADYAFENCTSLTSIYIPDSVTNIGNYAFKNCPLNYNEYDNAYYLGKKSNPYLVLVKAKNADIASCSINDNTQFIHSYAFRNCTSLTSITIPDSVTSIGNHAFENCTSLTNIYIPDSVTNIGFSAFAECDAVETATIPATAISFIPKPNLKTVVITGETSIKAYAFNNCTSLTNVTIGNSVTSIGYYAFYGCTSLTNVIIGNSVSSIENWAFSHCTSLTSIAIPESVTSIGNHAFEKCPLTYNEYDNAYYLGNESNPYLALVKVKTKFITSCSINKNTKIIGMYVFSTCSLTSVAIPAGVTRIDYMAFSSCASLTSVTIPESVSSIGKHAFLYCTSLTSITYNGTMEQWDAVAKHDSWDTNTGDYTIHCTDGDITKTKLSTEA